MAAKETQSNLFVEDFESDGDEWESQSEESQVSHWSQAQLSSLPDGTSNKSTGDVIGGGFLDFSMLVYSSSSEDESDHDYDDEDSEEVDSFLNLNCSSDAV